VEPPFDPRSLPPGTRIADKYVLGPSIGYGENSVVYSAMHRFLQRKAAVKVLGTTDPVSEKRFTREARLAGSLRHPNIVEVYEVGRLPDSRYFLVMEYLEGETVEHRLQQRGPFSVAEAMDVGRAVLEGLGAAHEQMIVHRDLRPENLFVVRARNEEVIKILDFGISRQFGVANESTLTAPGTILGDMSYLAPEQLYDEGEIDQRTDLYAAGVLVYRLLTNQSPFTSIGAAMLLAIVETAPIPPSQWRNDLPKDIDRVILKALSKKPEDRFEHAGEMSEALRLAGLFAAYVGH
jgi:serine/threonine-protein kinase